MKRPFQITIDGPAGSGKSSTAQIVAKVLGYYHINTGSIYRALTYKLLESGIDFNNHSAMTDYVSKLDIKFTNNEREKVIVNGEEVTPFLRTCRVNDAVSTVSKIGPIRDLVLPIQQSIGNDTGHKGIVMEGRDIGTIVFPMADLKIFLTADPKVRAARRLKEMADSTQSLQSVLSDIIARDDEDTHRDIAPLKQADDSVLLDTSNLTIDEQASIIIDMAKNISDE